MHEMLLAGALSEVVNWLSCVPGGRARTQQHAERLPRRS